MFISIEGSDGVGKTTIVEGIKKKYPDAIFIREPGTTTFGEEARKILLHSEFDIEKTTELLLFMASFAETSAKIIRKANAEGKLVVADRWFYTTEAYQSFSGGRNNHDRYFHFIRCIAHNSKIEVPKENFILDASWDTIQSRLVVRNKKLDNIEKRGLDFFKKVHEYYHEECDGTRINADRAPEEIIDDICQRIDKL